MSRFSIAFAEGRIKLDASDAGLLTKYQWCIDGRGYVMAYSHKENDKKVYVKLHRILLNAKPGELVDHINGDRLDNRRSNLRICTPQENVSNQRLKSNNTSGYKGVHWRADKNRWVAYITHNRKRHHLGHFHSEIQAALAYDSAAREYHKEFANLNFKQGE